MNELGDKIAKILTDARVPFTAHRTALVIDCQSPACRKAEHTWIRRTDGATKCMVCGQRWSIQGVLAKLLGRSKETMYSMLYGSESGQTLSHDYFEFAKLDDESFDEFEDEVSEVTSALPVIDLSHLHPVENSHGCIDYLAKRGVSLELAQKLDLRCHSFINGVFFIAKNAQGQTVGYQYRAINPEKGMPKTVTMKGFKKNLHLLFMDLAQDSEAWILVEGPFDAAKCMVNGFAAVASYGKLVSNQQIDLIENSKCSTVYVGLDRDAAKEASVVIERLSRTKKVFRLLPPEHRDDLGECSPEEVAECIANAIPCVGSRVDRLEVFFDA